MKLEAKLGSSGPIRFVTPSQDAILRMWIFRDNDFYVGAKCSDLLLFVLWLAAMHRGV